MASTPEIPLPEDSRIQESKVAAYEHEEMEKKEKERRSTYREMASLLDRKQADTVRLPTCLRKAPENSRAGNRPLAVRRLPRHEPHPEQLL